MKERPKFELYHVRQEVVIFKIVYKGTNIIVHEYAFVSGTLKVKST